MPRGETPSSITSKRMTPRRRRVIWYPIRLIGVGVSGVLGAFLLFQLVVKVAHPYKLGDEEARRVSALRERLARQEQINDRLDARLKYLESDEGTETQARRAGYHREGEAVYMLDGNALSAIQTSSPNTVPKAP